MNERQLVLVVEDTDEDFELLKIAMRRAKVTMRVERAKDGQEAIDYLHGTGKFTDREAFPFPGALFLDLKLPKLSGLEVLAWIKGHPECKVVPVGVLTSSALDLDVTRAYQLGANCYLVKPNTLDSLVSMVERVFSFWTMCTLPPLPKNC
jgi:CheY-like chemotaxis protein